MSTTSVRQDTSLAVVGHRFALLAPSITGDRPWFRLGGDTGFHHLGLALGVAVETLPTFDVHWDYGDLVKPQKKVLYKKKTNDFLDGAPVHILATCLADLVPQQSWDNDVQVLLYESDKLREMTKDLAPEFDKRLKSLRQAFLVPGNPNGQEIADRATVALTNKALLAQLEFATEYTMHTDSPYHLTRQLIKFLLAPELRWLWLVPAAGRFENQMDQVSEDQRAGRPPIIWCLSWLIHKLLMTVDTLLFGVPRESRLMAKKFGFENPELNTLTCLRNTRLKSEYGIRKAMSEDCTLITLWALGQADLVYWLLVTVKEEGARIHDMCDSIAMIFEDFHANTRDRDYSQKELDKIKEYLEKIRAKVAKNSHCVVKVNHIEDPFDARAMERIKQVMATRYASLDRMLQHGGDDEEDVHSHGRMPKPKPPRRKPIKAANHSTLFEAQYGKDVQDLFFDFDKEEEERTGGDDGKPDDIFAQLKQANGFAFAEDDDDVKVTPTARPVKKERKRRAPLFKKRKVIVLDDEEEEATVTSENFVPPLKKRMKLYKDELFKSDDPSPMKTTSSSGKIKSAKPKKQTKEPTGAAALLTRVKESGTVRTQSSHQGNLRNEWFGMDPTMDNSNFGEKKSYSSYNHHHHKASSSASLSSLSRKSGYPSGGRYHNTPTADLMDWD